MKFLIRMGPKRKVLEILQPTSTHQLFPRPKTPPDESAGEEDGSDWKKVADMDEDLYWETEAKSKSLHILSRMAQLLGKRPSQKGNGCFKKLAEDSGFEKMRMEFRKHWKTFERYSKQFKSKNLPRERKLTTQLQIPKYEITIYHASCSK